MPIVVDKNSVNLFCIADRVAQADAATILIYGETGTGKEVLAQYIYKMSNRSDRAFVAINCAAVPESLLESELFGHEKGAFTNALQRRIGKFEEANGGIILLDEISEMPLFLQAKLLRILQEKEFYRLGSNEKIKVDVRVIATTNKDLEEAVSEDKFREDLYYRLNVVPLHILPLRERKMDIIPLAIYFCKKYSGSKKVLGKELLNELKRKEWRGNVRELENFVHRAVIFSKKSVIEVDDVLDWKNAIGREKIINQPSHEEHFQVPSKTDNLKFLDTQYISSNQKTLYEIEKEAILNAFKKFQGNKRLVAEKLGISPRTLRYKLSTYQKEKNSLKDDSDEAKRTKIA